MAAATLSLQSLQAPQKKMLRYSWYGCLPLCFSLFTVHCPCFLCACCLHQMEVQAVMKANSCWYTFSEIVNTNTLIHALLGKPGVHIILLNEATGLSWPDLFRSLAQHQGQQQRQQQQKHKGKRGKQHHVQHQDPAWLRQQQQQEQERGQEVLEEQQRTQHEPIEVRVTALNLRFPQQQPPDSSPPGPSPAQQLQQLGHACGVRVVYRAVYAPCDLFDPDLVEVEPGEAVAFVSSWSLMLFPDESVLKANPRNAMLRVRHQVYPPLPLSSCTVPGPTRTSGAQGQPQECCAGGEAPRLPTPTSCPPVLRPTWTSGPFSSLKAILCCGIGDMLFFSCFPCKPPGLPSEVKLVASFSCSGSPPAWIRRKL